MFKKVSQKLIYSGILACPWVVLPAAIAEETPSVIQSNAPEVSESVENNSTDNNDAMEQVTNVSQLRDVQPTDWAYEALRAIVERYGCLAGYPDGTFRGDRGLTRYEFAAGLNACLQQVEKLIAASTPGTPSTPNSPAQQDLNSLRRLQEEFRTELATLGTRVNNLEGRTAFIEQRQFSATTKLNGEAIFAITGGGSGDGPVYASDTNVTGMNLDSFGRLLSRGQPIPPGTIPPRQGSVLSPTGNANVTFNSRVRLDLRTSFTGSDLLTTRLEVGSGGGTAGNILGNTVITSNFGNVGLDTFSLFYGNVPNQVTLAKLRYDFNVTRNLRLSIGPVMHIYDHVDRNSYANNEARDFSSTFFINNPLVALINNQQGGAGAAFDWNPGNGPFSLRAVYLAAEGSKAMEGQVNPAPPPNIIAQRGLLNNPYQTTVEVEYAPKSGSSKGPLAIRFQYSTGYFGNRDGETGGVNMEWAFSRNAAIFARYGFGRLSLIRGIADTGLNRFTNIASTRSQVSYHPQTFMAGLAFPDLLKPGSLAAIAVGQPFISEEVGDTTQTNLEAFIRFPINENITITPDIQFIFNPSNNSFNNTITVGTLRTAFAF